MDAIKKFLLLRFIPQRTIFGIGAALLAVLGAFNAIAGSDFCSAEGAVPAVCGFVAKAIPKVSEFLILIGVLDRDRK